MKKIGIFFFIFLVGCTNQNVQGNNIIENHDDVAYELKENLNFEFAQKVYLYELFEEKGNILNQNELIDTSSLGEHIINIELKNEVKQVKYNVLDTIAPIINVSNMSTTVGKEINFLNNLMCGDNYDRELECKILGEYDFNKVGTYVVKVTATDSSNNKNEKEFKLTVKEKGSSSSSSNKNYYYFDDLIKNYKNNNTMVGIDVSAWQGNINFENVKKAGAEFVMIRMGYGLKNEASIYDTYFKSNLKKAKEAGLKVGLYYYSYAKSTSEAKAQAKWIIDELGGENLDLPIAFDWEIWNGFNNYHLNFNDLNEIANAFITEINNANYEGVIYGSAFFLNKIWQTDSRVWLAYYTSNNDYEKSYFMWQLSSRGNINGINGYVDLDVLYLK